MEKVEEDFHKMIFQEHQQWIKSLLSELREAQGMVLFLKIKVALLEKKPLSEIENEAMLEIFG